MVYASVCPSCLRIWDRNLLLPPQLCWWLITWLNQKKKHTLNELWILSEACKNRNSDMIGLMPHSKFQIKLRRWFLSHPLLLLKKTTSRPPSFALTTSLESRWIIQILPMKRFVKHKGFNLPKVTHKDSNGDSLNLRPKNVSPCTVPPRFCAERGENDLPRRVTVRIIWNNKHKTPGTRWTFNTRKPLNNSLKVTQSLMKPGFKQRFESRVTRSA